MGREEFWFSGIDRDGCVGGGVVGLGRGFGRGYLKGLVVYLFKGSDYWCV